MLGIDAISALRVGVVLLAASIGLPLQNAYAVSIENVPILSPKLLEEKERGEEEGRLRHHHHHQQPKQQQQKSIANLALTPTTTTSNNAATVIILPSSLSKDKFGITQLYRTAGGGIEWFAKWGDGHNRTFENTIDPGDEWFDTAHGHGVYSVDGNGTLTASGNVSRMYVHDPAHAREWSENLEITLYIKRVNETQLVDYSGLLISARSNHGTTGNEDVNICDDRGYYGEVLIRGAWLFQKETAHHQPNGYASAAVKYPWAGLPHDKWIGVKYVIRNMDNNTKVKLELYRDMTNGSNGGSWEKITDFVDDGKNFGVGHDSCKPNVDPALKLMHSSVLASSETKKPMMSVYIKKEFATMDYSRFSIREIEPAP